MGTHVAVALDATWPDAGGMGQENLASHLAGDLRALVLAMLAESPPTPLYVGDGTKILTSWFRTIDLRRVLAGANFRSHFRESKPVLCKVIARN